MSVLLLDLRSLIFAGLSRALSTSSPLSTSQEVMDACDRLPWEECMLPTDLLLKTNLEKQIRQHLTFCVINLTARKIFIVPSVSIITLHSGGFDRALDQQQ